MPRVTVEPGVELAVQDLGEGPPVVFLPGFGLDHRVWDDQVRQLADRHRVVCIDQRGHGESDKPRTGYDLPRLSADAGTVLDRLEAPAATVVGWSFGGQVAFHLAASRRDLVARLVLVGSNGVAASRTETFPFGAPADAVLPALVEAEERDPRSSRRQMTASGFGGEPQPEVLDQLVDMSLAMPSWAAVACLESMLRTDLTDRLDSIEMPVLQVMGANDPVHSARGARWLAERLPDSTLVEIPDCGHYPPFEAREAFDRALIEWIDAA